MKNFLKVFWIARKNNYTMYWDNVHRQWNCCDWKTFTNTDIQNYDPFIRNSVIDFYKEKIKFLR